VTSRQQRLDVDALRGQLRAALPHGVRAAQLCDHTPTLIDLLCPAVPSDPATLADRAITAERIISDAAAAMDSPGDEAVRIMLRLAPGTRYHGVENRRERAARLFHIEAGTFRRGHREGALLFDLAVEIYRRRR
jgi:hypothetical protein